MLEIFGSHNMNLPSKNDFPEGSRFYIKEFDVPLVQILDGSLSKWFNWFGGKPKEYAPDLATIGKQSHLVSGRKL